MTQIKFPLKASLYLNTWKWKTRKNDLGTFLSFYIEQYVTPYNRGDPAKPSSLVEKIKYSTQP